MLRAIYASKQLQMKVRLDGGAALGFFYGIDRTFSSDLDFTVEDNGTRLELARTLKGVCPPSIGIDVFVVPARFCEFETHAMEDVHVVTHSIADLLAEKLCCLIDRDATRDVLDAANIISRYAPSSIAVSTLFDRKRPLKPLTDITLAEVAIHPEQFFAHKSWWKEYQVQWRLIQSYIKT